MVYPEDYESRIGYDRIRSQVAALCTTAGARGLWAGEGFLDEASAVSARLAPAGEMITVLRLETGFPASGEMDDLAPQARKLAVEGSFLEPAELLVLRRGLAAAGELSAFFAERPQNAYPSLKALSAGITGFPAIVNHIDSVIDRHGEVRDSASSELYSLRRTIRDREGQASKRLQAVLAAARSAGLVDDDAAVSIRDGRPVIPVPASNKRKVKGFIHDQSATGRTFWVEPVEVVEISNELRELEYAERREVVRVLTELADTLRPDAEGIARTAGYLCEMDLLRAKARWAQDNGAGVPVLSTDGRLELRRAAHPLLRQALAHEGRELVPLDLRLSASERIIVISGPNAGGKSVCLKTVGLLQYMLQCGMPVPASENSEMPVFRSIFIDIGDDQSIDNDLSTYSSHLRNMKRMLAGAGPHSLVLIDEFGSGTEPVIGGALAEAMLERLLASGAYGVVTTHYSNIKYFASGHEGILNGAMQFDVQNIRPLFRLETGMPGSSFAIEIARKTGLPEDIIRSASEKAGSDHINIERQLREIARDRRYWEQKRDRIRLADRRVEELESDYRERLEALRAERKEILASARAESERLVAEANRQIETTIRTIRETQAEREATREARQSLGKFGRELSSAPETPADAPQADDRIERELERLRRRRENREKRGRERKAAAAPEAKEPEKRPLEVGSKVVLQGQDTPGEVTALKGGRATVAFGQIITTVPVERLEVVSSAQYRRAARPSAPRTVLSADISERRLNFTHNLDVRGMRAAEAVQEVMDFIDDAVMVGVSEVYILHGKGTGALKEEIRRYLLSVHEVASAADEHPDRGGAGITVVRLRV